MKSENAHKSQDDSWFYKDEQRGTGIAVYTVTMPTI
jgi:hypothetical protein